MDTPLTLDTAGVSEREAEVLALLTERATNAEIAARLFVSVRTVESHVSALLRKLGASDRRELAAMAPALGWASGTSVGPLPHPADGSDATPIAAPARAPVPAPLTSFIGRTRELAALVEVVKEQRLVTATGPGGVGKTRLATAAAVKLWPSYRDGVIFLDLVPINDASLVPSAVTAALGLAEPHGCSVEDALFAYLSGRQALLVLDNCEHLVDGLPSFLERLLTRCPGISVLATSQVRLVVPFEQVFAVPALSLGTDGEGDAAALFLERAHQAGLTGLSDNDRRRVGAICRRLDGVALAIELAAARAASLGLDGVERGLNERLHMLSGGGRSNERHRSLRSAIDWSYELLAPTDQALLRRAAVFAGPFTPAAAVEVVGEAPLDPDAVASGLGRLADHSLLVVHQGRQTRYRVLETIRQYGAEQLVAHREADAVRGRHLAWAMDALQALGPGGPGVTGATPPASGPVPDLALNQANGGDQRRWRAAFDHLVAELRAALRWATRQQQTRPQANDVALSLADACFTRGMLTESQRRYEQAAEVAADGRAAAEALLLAADVAVVRYQGTDALALWRAAADGALTVDDDGLAAFALAKAAELITRGPGVLADRPGLEVADALLREARKLAPQASKLAPQASLADAAIRVAEAFAVEEGTVAAHETVHEALAVARHAGDVAVESAGLDALTAHQLALDDLPAAVATIERRVELISPLHPAAGNAFELSDTYAMASEVLLAAGDIVAARRYADTLAALPFNLQLDHLATSRRVKVDALAGEVARVLHDAELFRRGWEDAGRPTATSLGASAWAISMAHGLRGDDEARDEWKAVAAATGIDEHYGMCASGYGAVFDALVLLHRGKPAAAVARMDSDPLMGQRWWAGIWRTWVSGLLAEALLLAGADDAASRLPRLRAEARPNPIAAALIERAVAAVAGDTERLVALAEVFAGLACPYQAARTQIMAGGLHAERGEAAMAVLGAAPMIETAVPATP